MLLTKQMIELLTFHSLGGTGNCGPSFCKTKSTKPTCVFTKDSTVMNYPSEVAKNKCKVCTQPTLDRCSAASLKSVVSGYFLN